MSACDVEFGHHRRSWFSPILTMFTGVLGNIWAKVSDRKVAPINAEQGYRYGLEAAGISHHSSPFPRKALQIHVLQSLTLLRSFPLRVLKCGSILTHSGAKVQTFLSGEEQKRGEMRTGHRAPCGFLSLGMLSACLV